MTSKISFWKYESISISHYYIIILTYWEQNCLFEYFGNFQKIQNCLKCFLGSTRRSGHSYTRICLMQQIQAFRDFLSPSLLRVILSQDDFLDVHTNNDLQKYLFDIFENHILPFSYLHRLLFRSFFHFSLERSCTSVPL